MCHEKTIRSANPEYSALRTLASTMQVAADIILNLYWTLVAFSCMRSKCGIHLYSQSKTTPRYLICFENFTL